jgi:hypothetical protein
MDIQHEAYGELAGVLVDRPRMRYLDAARLLQVEAPYAEGLRGLHNFDHRGLQGAHDAIAAWFRWLKSDSRQYQLGEGDEEQRQRLKREWIRFFIDEVERLCNDDEFVRLACKAAIFGAKDEGDGVDELLEKYLRHHYSEKGLGKRDAKENDHRSS